jgi:fused signal recognition particle receptor
METTATPKDPFDTLLNAGSDPDIWLLLGGPALLLVVIVAIYAVVIFLRNRREKAEMDRIIESESAGVPSALPATPEALELDREALEPVPVPAPRQAPSDVDEIRGVDRSSWLSKLRGGLGKTRDALRATAGDLFQRRVKIDAGVLERLHESLYRADIGVQTADKLVDAVRQDLGKEDAADWQAVSASLRDKALTLMSTEVPPLAQPASGPLVILIVGVNGVGKTTSIGKLAAHFLAEDKKVLLAAADTFRAAAVDQLCVWGDRLGVDVIKHQAGSDPAAVAYDGVKAAIARNADVLLIDTAGRLHSKNELMQELGKINRVIAKDLPGAPHETWLVIDSTTGQNAVAQAKAFGEVVKLSGLIVTKLDGTAKGGVVLGIADQFKVPIRYVGVGEKAADLRGFNARDYVDSLF